MKTRAAVRMALVTAWLCVPAAAVTPAQLLGPDLEARKGQVVYLRGGELGFFDADRSLCSEPIDQLVQIRFLHELPENPQRDGADPGVDPAVPPSTFSAIELTDGQVLAGSWAGADGQLLRWRHPHMGLTTVSLDELRAVRFAPVLRAEGGGHDLVQLANGDMLLGYVLALQAESIEFQLAGEGAGTAKLSVDRIKSLSLANEPDPVETDHQIVWLRDGTRLNSSSLGIENNHLQLETRLKWADGAPRRSVALKQVQRIDLAMSGRRLVSLADQPLRVVAGGAVFGRQIAPLQDKGGLRIHAPIAVEIDLPAGASRLGGIAELDLSEGGVSSGFAQWADFELVLSLDGREVDRHHFDHSSPSTAINVPVNGAVLRIELLEAANGPIMDRLHLRGLVVLVMRH